jgi:hypothetical protein
MEYSNVVPELITRVPEFAASDSSWSTDLPHDALGSFALFLCKQIHQGVTESLLSRAFDFLNEMASSKDEDIVNLLVVSVLEVIADDERCQPVAQRYLSDYGRSLLNRVVSRWDSDE